MKAELINLDDKPHISNDSNEPINAPPVARPYVVQQIPQQYLVQQLSQPYVTQPFYQPYIIQQVTQPYIIPPVIHPYFFQPGIPVAINSDYLKKKLFYPKFWTWFMFAVSLIDILIYYLNNKLPVIGVVSCIVFFIIAFLVNQSAEICDAKKYNTALNLYTIYFVLACVIHILVFFFLAFSRIRKMILKMYIFEFPFELITLCVLCFSKKIFVVMANPEKQQLVTPQQI